MACPTAVQALDEVQDTAIGQPDAYEAFMIDHCLPFQREADPDSQLCSSARSKDNLLAVGVLGCAFDSREVVEADNGGPEQ